MWIRHFLKISSYHKKFMNVNKPLPAVCLHEYRALAMRAWSQSEPRVALSGEEVLS